jgi:hypothetical protein
MYIIIWLIFETIAGITVELIVYGEFKRHFVNSNCLITEAFKIGIFTFIFFDIYLLVDLSL